MQYSIKELFFTDMPDSPRPIGYFIFIFLVLGLLVIAFFTTQILLTSENVVQSQEHTELVFSGDTMMGRYVETLTKQHGKQYPFEHLKGFFKTMDLVSTNFEGLIHPQHQQTPDFTFNFSFPTHTAKTLHQAGITFVTLGNNHTDDFYSDVFSYTQKHLDLAGIAYAGHPTNDLSESLYSTIIHDQRIILLSYDLTSGEYTKPLYKQVKSLQDKENAFIVVQLHWGIEYENTSASSQQKIAYEFIESGADLIIGHHPHVVQELEVYKDALIAYSLGNLIFDQYFSDEVQTGLMIQVSLTDEDVMYTLHPYTSHKSQPRFMEDEERSVFLETLKEKSPTLSHKNLRSSFSL